MFLVWLLQKYLQVSQEHRVFHQFTDGWRFGGFSEEENIQINPEMKVEMKSVTYLKRSETPAWT